MEEKNEAGEPRRYVWPRYALAGVVLWIVLALIWVGVLVHRTREQRDTMQWTSPMSPAPVKTLPQTNSVSSKTNDGAQQAAKPAATN